MKDLYSFNRDQKGLDKFYEEATDAYFKIFKRIGLGDSTYLTFASGGAFSKYSHEFQTICDSGEDTIYLDRKKKVAVNDEVYEDKVLKDLGLKRGELEEVRAIETGNIFKLGTRFSDAMGLTYLDKSGKLKPVVMGSYGIGPARSMGTIVELFNDENGIIWPDEVAPHQVHLIELPGGNGKKIYEKLLASGIEVLWDDREESAGQKFADADLIGIPVRLVTSKKTEDKIEYKLRSSDTSSLMTLKEVFSRLQK